MDLDKLLIKKDEIPIIAKCHFEVPIHPGLLNPNLNLDPKLANRLFPQATDEWYEDLQNYVEKIKEGEQKNWLREVFLKKEPKITQERDCQRIDGYWQDDTCLEPNGFARVLSISRNGGGSLYFIPDDLSCESFISLDKDLNRYMKFPSEKAKLYAKKIFEANERTSGAAIVHIYGKHNVDHYPGALFLRNWAILYLNEAIKQAFG